MIIMSKLDGITVRIPTAEEFSGVLDLRWRVLDQPVGAQRKDAPSNTDVAEGTIHVAAFDGDRVVSTVRLDPRLGQDGPIYLVRRMATDPDYRRRGIGGAVLTEAEHIAAVRGATGIVLHARLGAVAFYESMGYTATGHTEIHDGEATPEMIKSISS